MTYNTVSGAHAAQRLWCDWLWLFFGGGCFPVVGGIFLVVEGGQTVLAAEFLHDSFSIWSQDDVLRPKYQPEARKRDAINFRNLQVYDHLNGFI